MIQKTNFLFSKKVFAFDTQSYNVTPLKNGGYQMSCFIIKFGIRKATKRKAVFRNTVFLSKPDALTYEEFLREPKLGLYAQNSWDGEEIWGVTKLAEMNELADYLNPLLLQRDQLPVLPEQFDGWWENA
jgi:hypothetical protein